MADSQVVQVWLDKADEDFNFASATLGEGNKFYAQICFHYQQAAEKYLKASCRLHEGQSIESERRGERYCRCSQRIIVEQSQLAERVKSAETQRLIFAG